MLQGLLALIILPLTTPLWSAEIDMLLASKDAPAGVVFEIVSDESDLLGKLLPSLKKDINKLRERFPDLPVAIVTHGEEQFALSADNADRAATTHGLVRDLVSNNQVEVHVCGTHAGWYGVMPEEFPDYVDVAAAGPVQINDYEALGYEVITLTD
jgi:intracellular sulfur oxidation DsrE/DsrF family protein